MLERKQETLHTVAKLLLSLLSAQMLFLRQFAVETGAGSEGFGLC